MHVLIAAQVAFCVLVLFIAGLFVTTFERLSQQATGFSTERILTLDTVAEAPGRPMASWNDTADRLRAVPGVERVAMANQSLLSGSSQNNFLSIDGAPPGNALACFMSVSPGWLDTMRIPLIAGRDVRATDRSPGAALVNETFARIFFNGENPVGRRFVVTHTAQPYEIVGLVRDARYRNMREAIWPASGWSRCSRVLRHRGAGPGRRRAVRRAPLLRHAAGAVVASLPPVLRALRTDLVKTLHAN